MLNSKTNQPSKFRTKSWVEINNEEHGTNGTGSHIKFKPTMLKSSLYDCSHAYIIVKGSIRVVKTAAEHANKNNRNKKVISIYWLYKCNKQNAST